MTFTEKQERHRAICDIISQEPVQNQTELLSKLAEKGIVLTQATLSRDFRELKVAKKPDPLGRYIYQLDNNSYGQDEIEKQRGVLIAFNSKGFLNIEFSGNFMVIRTQPCDAQMVAHEIDKRALTGIAGTIAGVDTVFAVLRDDADKASILNAIKHLFTP